MVPADGADVAGEGALELGDGAVVVVVAAVVVGCPVPDDRGVEPVPHPAARAARDTTASRVRRVPGRRRLTARFWPASGRRRWRP